MNEQVVLEHFKLPITFDKNGGYFFDSNQQMVGEVRGWGHLHNLLDGAEIQDKLGEMFCTAFNEKFSHPISGSAERVEEAANEYLKKVGSVHGKEFIRHDFIEGWKAAKKTPSSADEGREKAADEYISFLEEYWGIPDRGIQNSRTEKFRTKYLAAKQDNK